MSALYGVRCEDTPWSRDSVCHCDPDPDTDMYHRHHNPSLTRDETPHSRLSHQGEVICSFNNSVLTSSASAREKFSQQTSRGAYLQKISILILPDLRRLQKRYQEKFGLKNFMNIFISELSHYFKRQHLLVT